MKNSLVKASPPYSAVLRRGGYGGLPTYPAVVGVDIYNISPYGGGVAAGVSAGQLLRQDSRRTTSRTGGKEK